jgi:acyl-coenzyme A synthetase/AMP-(fatty) acid ligase
MKPEYDSKSTDDPELAKELTLQVRKVIGPFAAPKKIVSLVAFSTEESISLSSLSSRIV